jgi:hypothetical protein
LVNKVRHRVARHHADAAPLTHFQHLAAKAKIFPSKPVLGTFLVMFAIMNVVVLRLQGMVRFDQNQPCRYLGGLPMALSGSQSV